jgi:hypothetical protein
MNIGGDKMKRSTEGSAHATRIRMSRRTVTSEEIGRVKTHLDGLDDKLSSGLGQGVRSETSVEPDTLICQSLPKVESREMTYSPPSSVGLVVLELSRQEDGDQDLEYTPLNSDDSNDTEDRMRGGPTLEVPE